MSKSTTHFVVVLIVSCIFALFSLWIGFFAALVFWHVNNSDLAWNLTIYLVYYVANAILCLFVGMLSGFDIKKRFYAPVVTAICLVPTVLIFISYTGFWDWFCIATTLAIGLVAMFVSAAVTRKNAAKLNAKTVATN